MATGYFLNSKSSHRLFNEALGLFRDPEKRSWILIAPGSLGETWLLCAFARAFRLQHPGPLTVVIKKSHAPIAQLYSDDISRIVPIDGDLPGICRTIHPYCVFAMDIPYIVDQFFFGDGRLMHLDELLFQPNRGGLRLVDQFRYIMHMDWDTPVSPGTVPAVWRQEAEIVADQLGLVRGRSVILFPDNNSTWPVADEVWQKLADDLRAQGLMVVTNLHGNDLRNFHGDRRQPFAGTTGYSLPLHLAAPLVEIAGGFVSVCNGICSVIVGTARCKSAILLHQTLPGQRAWNGYDVETALAQSLKMQTFDFSGLVPHNLMEYVIHQGGDNTDALAQIVQQMAQ